MSESVELLRVAAHVLTECKAYPTALKARALKEAKAAYRVASGKLQPERGTLTLRKSA